MNQTIILRRSLFLLLLVCGILSFFFYMPPSRQLDYLIYLSGFMILSTLALDSVGLFICFHVLLFYTFFNTYGDIGAFQTLWLYFLGFICIFFTQRSKIGFISSLFMHFLFYLLFNISLYIAYNRCHNEDIVPQMEGFKAIILFLFSCPLAIAITHLSEATLTKTHDRKKTEDFLEDAISLPFQMIGLIKRKLSPEWKYWGLVLGLCLICFGAFYYFYNPAHLIAPSFCGY